MRRVYQKTVPVSARIGALHIGRLSLIKLLVLVLFFGSAPAQGSVLVEWLLFNNKEGNELLNFPAIHAKLVTTIQSIQGFQIRKTVTISPTTIEPLEDFRLGVERGLSLLEDGKNGNELFIVLSSHGDRDFLLYSPTGNFNESQELYYREIASILSIALLKHEGKFGPVNVNLINDSCHSEGMKVYLKSALLELSKNARLKSKVFALFSAYASSAALGDALPGNIKTSALLAEAFPELRKKICDGCSDFEAVARLVGASTPWRNFIRKGPYAAQNTATFAEIDSDKRKKAEPLPVDNRGHVIGPDDDVVRDIFKQIEEKFLDSSYYPAPNSFEFWPAVFQENRNYENRTYQAFLLRFFPSWKILNKIYGEGVAADISYARHPEESTAKMRELLLLHGSTRSCSRILER